MRKNKHSRAFLCLKVQKFLGNYFNFKKTLTAVTTLVLVLGGFLLYKNLEEVKATGGLFVEEFNSDD